MTEHTIPALASAKEQKSCGSCRWMRKTRTAYEPNKCAMLNNKPVDLTIMSIEEQDAQHQMLGAGCPKYNDDGPPHPDTPLVTVAFPGRTVDPDLITDYQRAQVASCVDCSNYIEGDVAAQLGFGGLPMCLAKGAIIRNVTLACSDCDSRTRAERDSGSGFIRPTLIEAQMMTLFPEYNKGRIDIFIKKRDEALGGGKCLPDGFDPTTWQSEVNTDLRSQGVRAWVEIKDPSGTGNHIGLPIFDPNFFSPEERAKIPSSASDERPDLYVDHAGALYTMAVAFMALDETPALWGMPGVGKTELARYLAWVMQLPFERISITDTTELDDLQGSMRFENNQTVFHPGRVARAWAKPCVLLIDEPNVGPRAVWQFLRPLTDNSKQLVIDADRGQPIQRNANCYLLFAMNPAWDIRNDGTNTLADADIRRLFHIEMHLPTPEVERKIITTHCKLDGFDIPDSLVDLVMSVAEGIRAQDNGALPITWGIASQIKVARYLNWFKPLDAYRIAAVDSLEPDVRDLILSEVRTKFGVRG